MSVLNLEPLSIGINPSMYTLSAGVVEGLQVLDQLHEPTADHLADENARMNCVFTSYASVSRKIGGHPFVNGDDIKDGCAHYGQNYVGGADAEVVESDGCLDNKWGIHADTMHYANRTAMLNSCMGYADAGKFTMVTIPSAWGSQPSQPGYNPDNPNFWTHACIYCGYTTAGQHVLANPWGGFLMYYSFQDLALRLCYLKVYPIRPAAVQPQGNPVIILEKNSSGIIVGAHDKDHPELHLGQGIAQAASDGHFLAGSIAVPETKLASGEVFAVVRGGAFAAFTYSAAHGTKTWADDVVLALNDLYDENKKLRAQVVPPVDNTKAVADLKAASAALNSAISEVK